MKKLCSLFLGVCLLALCLCLHPQNAHAETEGYYTYTVSSGEATITDCNTGISGAVTIPDTLGGYPVTAIGNSAFRNCTGLTSITIPDGFTSIGNSAFYDCTGLTSVTIGNSVSSIGNCAFYNCTGLTSVTIGNGVTSIGEDAFYNCTGLTSITIPDSVSSIGNCAFYNCTGLTSVTIGNSVTSIGSSAFDNCTGLTSITIPDSVTSICGGAFSGCSNLEGIWVDANNTAYINDTNGAVLTKDKTTLVAVPGKFESYTIPDSVTSIGDWAFEDCTGLTSIIIPDSVTSIGVGAFDDCTGLTSITILGSVTYIGGETFCSCTGLTDVYITDPNSWCKINFDAPYASPMRDGTHLHILNEQGEEVTEVVLDDSVTTIPSMAFKNCTGLTSITIPDSVTSIGNWAFGGCTGLTSIIIPDSVTSIGAGAFNGCTGLTSITILGSVTYIGGETFCNCTGLTDVYITDPNSWCKINFDDPFASPMCDEAHLHILNEQGEEVTEVVLDDSVTTIPSMAFKNCTGLTTITIPDSVTAIGDSAFYKCTGLTSITIPDSVTYIGWSAFENCTGLTSITIPDGVTYIGWSAFENCTGLTSITIPDGVTSIGSYAFQNCTGLFDVYITDPNSWCKISFGNSYANPMCSGCHLHILNEQGEEVTEVVLDNSVTEIPDWAFEGCTGLTTITIPDSVTSIGDSAFWGCTGLTDVYITDPNSWCKLYLDITNVPMRDGAQLHILNEQGEEVTEVVLDNSITTIPSCAFWGCTGLTTITIPDSVTSIGYQAFYNCTGLTSITIPDGVTFIEYDTFRNCTKLTSITIPDSVTSIGYQAFYNCTGLTSITIPDSVTSIVDSAFSGCTGLTSITIPDSVTSIGSGAFSGCSNLESITLPFVGKNRGTGSYVYSFGYIFGTSSYTGGAATEQRYYSSSDDYSVTYCIPKKLKTVTITDDTAIRKYAFYNCTGLTSITIPDSVTSIGDSAFSGCTGLTSITIPDSVTSIGSGAFSGCSNLESITLPFVGKNRGTGSYVYPFGYIFGTFSYSGGVATTQRYYSSSSGYKSSTYYIPEKLKTVTITDDTAIRDYAFEGCTGLTTITIPDSVTSIAAGAFSGCSNLESMTLPFVGLSRTGSTSEGYSYNHLGEIFGSASYTGGVKIQQFWYYREYDGFYYKSYYIPEKLSEITVTSGTMLQKSFSGCTMLTSITIPDSVTYIGESAFYYCTGLTAFTIPDSVTSIDRWAFSGCIGLTSIIIPNNITSIGNYAFEGCTGLTTISIPCSVGNAAFGDCTALITANIESGSVAGFRQEGDAIYFGAFANCKQLTTVTIGSGVSSIGGRAFSGCTELTQILVDENNEFYSSDPQGVLFDKTKTTLILTPSKMSGTYTIPNSVTDLGSSAFSGCTGLTSVTIPDSVTSIGSSAFYGCTGLTSITIPNGVTSIGSSAFYSCTGLPSIIIPNNVTSIGNYAFKDCTGLASVTIGNSVTDLGGSAFYGCTGLTSITIPGNINSIGNYAFEGCTGLTSAIIGNGVASIGGDAFRGCTGLTSITIPDSVTSIGSYAFRGCTALISAIIGNGVRCIEDRVFEGCTKMSTVTIGNSVIEICEAFNGCTGLKTVFYRGTEEQRSRIGFYNDTTNLTNATWHYEVTDVQLGEETVYHCGKCNLRYYNDGTNVPLAQLTVLKAPDNVRYFTGGTVSLVGISLQGTYADGFSITFGADEVEEVTADLSTPGKKTATVTLLGCSAEFEIIVHDGSDGSLVTVDSSLYPESDHNYGDNLSQTKTFAYPGALSLIITFNNQTSVESNYDYIYVYDGSGKQIAKYTGTAAAGVTLAIPGDTFQIKLTSDGSSTKYGYAFTSIVANMGVEKHLPLEGSGTVIPSSCSEQGYTQYTCSICGDLYNDDYMDFLPHSFSGWQLTTVATCTKDGTISRSCTVCSHTESVAVAATGHSFEIVTTPPTCTEAGTETRTCTTCQAVETTTIAATGHSYEIVTTSPTCTEEGVEYRTCSVCGAAESVAIPAAGHSYDSSVTPPTCTTDGYTTHTCSTCGNSYTDSETAATGHSFGNWVIGKLPTCDTDGSMVRTCTVCSEQESLPVTASGHSYENGVCTVCKKAELIIPVITPKYPSLSFEDEVYISVYFQVSDMTDVVDLGLVVSSDATVDENDTMVTEYGYKGNSDISSVRTHGIPAKSLGETIYFKVYAKLSDGSYVYSGVYNYSALAYAKDRIANSSNANLKKLCVAMLNYGAAAQTYMGYNVDSLANAALTADQLAMVEGYNSSMIASVTAVDSDKMGVFTRSGFGKCYPSISFEGAFSISYYFTPSYTPDNGMKLYYWDKEAFDGVDVLTVDNATGVLDMIVSGTAYKGAVEGIAAKEVDETIFVAGVYEYDGVTYCTGVIPYSLGAYCVDRAANGSAAMIPLAEATAVYGYYAKQYFA